MKEARRRITFLAVALSVGACSSDPAASAGVDAAAPSTPGDDGGTSVDAADAEGGVPDPPAVGCPALPAPTGRVVEVGDVAALAAAVSGALSGDTISIADGSYSITSDLWISASGVTLRGKSGDREKVILDANYHTGAGQSIVTVAASNVTVAHLSVRRAYDHPIHVDASSSDVTGTLIYDVHVVDPGQQGIKINPDGSYVHAADQGTIACSKIELTDAGRGAVRDNCYTGGIDAHAARGWVVRDNVIEGFYCASGLSEHAIHFWRGGRDNVIERNVIKNSARGIGFGLGETGPGRTYADDPCPGTASVGAFGGVIRNNFIVAESAALHASSAGFDTGVGLEKACATNVVHNTVVSTQSPRSSAMEWRFAGTTATLTNNLATHLLLAREGATATLAGNIDSAAPTWFSDVAAADLHLSASAAPARNAGVAVSGDLCPSDIDGAARSGATPDVGADEVP